MGLGSHFFEEHVTEKVYKPSDADMIFFTFFEKGIGYNELRSVPIPHIMRMMNTFKYVEKKREEANKKANKK